MAVPQTHWMNKSIRIPPQMEAAIIEYAHENGYTTPDGEVNWGATLRSLLAYSLDALSGGGLGHQARTLYQNAQAEALHKVRKLVMDTLELTKDEDF